jgi:CheY-like chemotaxis protein
MKKGKILVIDDDEIQLKLVDAMLTPQGYEVHKLRDGKGAVDTARGLKPDIILLDVMMPGVDGYTALNALKNDPLTKPIPVVMVTAIGHELNKKLAEQLGASGYITKPITLKELLKTVGDFLPGN